MFTMCYKLDESKCRNLELSSSREWILTNGLGGYAMGTVSGIATRKYHGLLVAAHRSPVDRIVLLAAIDVFVQCEGNPIGLSTNQYIDTIYPNGYQYIEQFKAGESVYWRFRCSGMVLEQRVKLHQGANAVTIKYTNAGEKPMRLRLDPLVCHKPYHENFRHNPSYPEFLTYPPNQTVVEHQDIKLVLYHPDAQRTDQQGWYYRFQHNLDAKRGLAPNDDLFCPCELLYELMPGESAVLTAAVGDLAKPCEIEEIDTTSHYRVGELLQAATKHYLVKSNKRSTIIAGYPWFGDWGRDTMISLPGICLSTGHTTTARQILSDYASQMFQGLIPNRFVEQGDEPVYNTVDATLWFVNSAWLTLEREWDDKFAAKMMKAFQEVFDWHQKGTLFGIRVDPEDGLLTQGEAGVQLTWMDAKVGGWVVTPRHGKPVEINGLWINALRIMERLAAKLGKPAKSFQRAAELAEKNFDSKFFDTDLGFYRDTVDPIDASLRPNQLIAMSLPFGPATGEHAESALHVISQELLTPMGIRTLSPHDPNYHGKFVGQLEELDTAYHQGTAWPWLLGPYVMALVKLRGDRQEAKRILKGVREMLCEYGIGGIAEVYDGDEPQNPGGCPWQAWSVAEFYRAWKEVSGE